jgi:hypothetical protein
MISFMALFSDIINVFPSELPYTVLLKLKMPNLPTWPEIPPLEPAFALWPNPTQGPISIETDKTWGSETILEIYDMLGQRLMRGMLHKTAMPIDLGLVSSQTLLVRLVDEEGKRQIVRRLVLRK